MSSFAIQDIRRGISRIDRRLRKASGDPQLLFMGVDEWTEPGLTPPPSSIDHRIETFVSDAIMELRIVELPATEEMEMPPFAVHTSIEITGDDVIRYKKAVVRESDDFGVSSLEYALKVSGGVGVSESSAVESSAGRTPSWQIDFYRDLVRRTYIAVKSDHEIRGQEWYN